MLTPSAEQIEAYLWGERFDDRLNLLIEDHIEGDDKWSEARVQIESIQATAKAEFERLKAERVSGSRNRLIVIVCFKNQFPKPIGIV